MDVCVRVYARVCMHADWKEKEKKRPPSTNSYEWRLHTHNTSGDRFGSGETAETIANGRSWFCAS